ncbi:Hypp4557 [Branchiostoma lanceolatum]|uniref:Hypp4557 protein n=1 Tax=Branchiostoma lanceolatum TaxID=7740 RepID=A0A8K0EW62_BRALA|nr:Hypp4557 [Branchiostoma lanceolatum]
MADNYLWDLYLEISRNLKEQELTDLRNYVSDARILPVGAVQQANAYEIFFQLEREQKLKSGNLTLLIDLLRIIGRHDYATKAEAFDENERKDLGNPAKRQRREEVTVEDAHGPQKDKLSWIDRYNNEGHRWNWLLVGIALKITRDGLTDDCEPWRQELETYYIGDATRIGWTNCTPRKWSEEPWEVAKV